MESGSDRQKDEVVMAEADLDVHTKIHWFLDSNRILDYRNHPSHFFTALEVWDRRKQTIDPQWISSSSTK